MAITPFTPIMTAERERLARRLSTEDGDSVRAMGRRFMDELGAAKLTELANPGGSSRAHIERIAAEQAAGRGERK